MKLRGILGKSEDPEASNLTRMSLVLMLICHFQKQRLFVNIQQPIMNEERPPPVLEKTPSRLAGMRLFEQRGIMAVQKLPEELEIDFFIQSPQDSRIKDKLSLEQ